MKGSTRGNWDPREGQQLFRPNPNGVGDRTTTLRRLLIGSGTFSYVSRPYAVSLLPHGAPLRSTSLSLLYKSFLQPLLTYASPGWFPFLSATNSTKLKRLHREASRAITGCLSSSPIPLLLSEASLPPLRVTLTHFTLFSYERALRLPTSFPISGLARLGVTPRLCRSSWRAFASTHPLMLPSTCFREALFACSPFPP